MGASFCIGREQAEFYLNGKKGFSGRNATTKRGRSLSLGEQSGDHRPQHFEEKRKDHLSSGARVGGSIASRRSGRSGVEKKALLPEKIIGRERGDLRDGDGVFN